jgi:hypothetical protein
MTTLENLLEQIEISLLINDSSLRQILRDKQVDLNQIISADIYSKFTEVLRSNSQLNLSQLFEKQIIDGIIPDFIKLKKNFGKIQIELLYKKLSKVTDINDILNILMKSITNKLTYINSIYDLNDQQGGFNNNYYSYIKYKYKYLYFKNKNMLT